MIEYPVSEYHNPLTLSTELRMTVKMPIYVSNVVTDHMSMSAGFDIIDHMIKSMKQQLIREVYKEVHKEFIRAFGYDPRVDMKGN